MFIDDFQRDILHTSLMANNQRVNWCWTLNNPTDAEVVSIRSHTITGTVKYLVYGQEVGVNQTPHLQGYLELAKKQRLGTVKKIAGLERAHFEPRMGSQEKAINYCKKGEQSHQEWTALGEKGPNYGKNAKVTEMGTKTVQAGNSLSEKQNLIQNRLISIRDSVSKGSTEKDIYESEPLMAAMYPKYIDKIISWKKPAIRENLKVELHVGPTGSGKTHDAFVRYPDLYNMPVKSGSSLWFNGYHGEKVVLFDDFKGAFTLDQLLRLLDKYPVQTEIKSGMTWFTPDLIIVTSNFVEDEWYDYTTRMEHKAALKRRFTSRYKWSNYKKTECGSDWLPLMFQPVAPTVQKTQVAEIIILSDTEEESYVFDEPDWEDYVDSAVQELSNKYVTK